MNPLIKQVQINATDYCLVLRYKNTYSCTDAFFRIDELSNYLTKFRSKHITREELLDRYCKRTGKPDYHEQWIGYCVTGKDIYRVTENCHDLSDKERELKILCFDCEIRYNTVVIACIVNDEETYLHELAHAYYEANKQYRTEINSLLKKIGSIKALKADLKTAGYTPTYEDEIHAYMVAGHDNRAIFSSQSLEFFNLHHKKFKDVFNRAVNGEFNVPNV